MQGQKYKSMKTHSKNLFLSGQFDELRDKFSFNTPLLKTTYLSPECSNNQELMNFDHHDYQLFKQFMNKNNKQCLRDSMTNNQQQLNDMKRQNEYLLTKLNQNEILIQKLQNELDTEKQKTYTSELELQKAKLKLSELIVDYESCEQNYDELQNRTQNERQALLQKLSVLEKEIGVWVNQEKKMKVMQEQAFSNEKLIQELKQQIQNLKELWSKERVRWEARLNTIEKKLLSEVDTIKKQEVAKPEQLAYEYTFRKNKEDQIKQTTKKKMFLSPQQNNKYQNDNDFINSKYQEQLKNQIFGRNLVQQNISPSNHSITSKIRNMSSFGSLQQSEIQSKIQLLKNKYLSQLQDNN